MLALDLERSSVEQLWREDPGLLSRPCRKRRPSAREDGGVSGAPGSPEGNTEGPGTASSEPLLPS